MQRSAKNVIIIEDNPDLGAGYKMLINTSPNYEVIDLFDNCEEALLKVKSLSPDIILMDIDLPGIDGIEGTRRIKAILPSCNIIIITVFENSRKVFDALCAGATGYLTKNCTHIELLDALDEVSSGGSPMSARIARMVVESFKKNIDTLLTDKELEVLTLLSEGKSYKSISGKMTVSIDNTKFHIKNIYLKLQVNCREDAIAIARAKKWI